MGKMNRESQGDSAPSRAAYLDVGRFRLTPGIDRGTVWVRNMDNGEGGPVDATKLEAALLRWFGGEF